MSSGTKGPLTFYLMDAPLRAPRENVLRVVERWRGGGDVQNVKLVDKTPETGRVGAKEVYEAG